MNQLKGTLYLLRHRSLLVGCVRDWRYVPEFAISLCRAQHEDKVSMKMDQFDRSYSQPTLAFHPRTDSQSIC